MLSENEEIVMTFLGFFAKNLEIMARENFLTLTPKAKLFCKWEKEHRNEIKHLTFEEQVKKFNQYYERYSKNEK
jgi:hypothetical protein